MGSTLSRYRHSASSLLHRALVGPLVLQKIPPIIAAVLLVIVALLPVLRFDRNVRVAVGCFHVGLLLADWLTLYGLPRTRRSFGPVAPPLYAITALRGLLTTVIGLLTGRSEVALFADVVIQITILVLSIYGQWVEPVGLIVSYETLTSKKLNLGDAPIRLLHLADLHVEQIGLREEKLQSLVADIAPDIIVFSGDFINLSYNQDLDAVATVRTIISEWHAPYGVFCVSGSPLVETQELVTQFVEGLDIRWLRNEVVEVVVRGQRIRISGITCTHQVQPDSSTLTDVLSNSFASADFSLFLYHSPDLAPIVNTWGIDLYLCGHTRRADSLANLWCTDNEF